MLDIGEKISSLRKKHNLSQTDLAKQVGVSRTIIGNYERNSNSPSIEILSKIATTFNVSIDFLVGQGQLASYNKEVLKRINDIENLDEETRGKLFFLIDNVIQNFKTKQAFSK